MFPYRVKYTESETDIQNINLLYKIDPQCQNTFDFLGKIENVQKHKELFFIWYTFHNFYNIWILGLLYTCIWINIYIYIYIYIDTYNYIYIFHS